MSGKCILIMGPMFSGKTQRLFQYFSNYIALGFKCLYINSQQDIREKTDYSTHSTIFSQINIDNKMLTSIKTENLNDVSNYDDYNVIGIDEQHLYPDLIEIVKKLVNKDKIVLVAGLNGDSKMKKIGLIAELIPFADDIIFIKAVCTKCIGETPPYHYIDAPFSVRKRNSIAIRGKTLNGEHLDNIDIGGGDKYYAACRTCYYKN